MTKKTPHSKNIPLDYSKEVAKNLPKQQFKSIREMMRIARMMYGMPLEVRTSHNFPLGYDSLRVIDGKEWAWPNDEAFRLLVHARILSQYSSTRRIAGWLDKELHKIGYNFDHVLRYNPKRGLTHVAVDRVIKYRMPLDECLLPLDERTGIFKIEAEGEVASRAADDGVDAQSPD